MFLNLLKKCLKLLKTMDDNTVYVSRGTDIVNVQSNGAGGMTNPLPKDTKVRFTPVNLIGDKMWDCTVIETGKTLFYPYKEYEIEIHFSKVS